MSAIGALVLRLRPAVGRVPTLQRSLTTSRSMRLNGQDMRSKPSSEQPMSTKSKNQSMTLAAVGLGGGLVFFYLLSRPEKPKEQSEGVDASPK